MGEIRTTGDLQPAIAELIVAFRSQSSEYKEIANSFEQFTSPRACWTTSTEFLTELRKVVNRALIKINTASRTENEQIAQLKTILKVIDDAVV